MSAQAGVLYFDKRDVAPETIAAIDQRLREYGPDGHGQHVGSGVAMIYRALHATPEDKCQHQPFKTRDGTVLTFDGRIDNRSDLLIRCRHMTLEDKSDVALFAALYEKWGAEGFSDVIGDWSATLWDENTRTLVLASDYMGIRPLYYVATSSSVTWSTTLESLVRLHRLQEELDERYLVCALTSRRSTTGLTPYKQITSVPAGHSISFDRQGNISRKKFWQVGGCRIEYRNRDQYDEHLRTLFLEVVENRLRSTNPVWAELSGGLDSSAIVCAADVLLRESRSPCQGLNTVSFVTDSSPEADERRFMLCVEQQCGRPSFHLPQDHTIEQFDPRWHWISPTQPRYPAIKAYRLILEQGGRVLLTGEGGDSVMANFVYYHQDVAALVQQWRLKEAITLARLRADAGKDTIWHVMNLALRELQPRRRYAQWATSRLLESCGGKPPATDQHVADAFLLNIDFARWWREDTFARCERAFTYEDTAQRRMATDILGVVDTRLGQTPSDVPCPYITHPYWDRRLVEFMLGVPITVSAPPGQPRALMRSAFGPFMPARIVSRVSKGAAGSFYLRNLREVLLTWLERPERLRVLRFGFLDLRRLVRYLEGVRDGSAQPAMFMTLLRIEQWLDSREQYLSGSHAEPQDQYYGT